MVIKLNNEKLIIKEVIIVEGKDDERAVKNSVDAEVITTSGWGLNERIIKRIKEAEKRCGVIIFTDPDFAGEKIRDRLCDIVLNPKHAFLPKNEAMKGDNIGIENANSESIVNALKKVRPEKREYAKIFTKNDLIKHELSGTSNSSVKRDEIGKILGIGYGNAKQFLKRLNKYGVTREEFENAIIEYNTTRSLK